MSYITPLHGSPAVSWTTNIHPSILWHFVKYNLYQIRCDYPAEGLNRMGYRLRNVVKAKPQKKFQKLTPSLKTLTPKTSVVEPTRANA